MLPSLQNFHITILNHNTIEFSPTTSPAEESIVGYWSCCWTEMRVGHKGPIGLNSSWVEYHSLYRIHTFALWSICWWRVSRWYLIWITCMALIGSLVINSSTWVICSSWTWFIYCSSLSIFLNATSCTYFFSTKAETWLLIMFISWIFSFGIGKCCWISLAHVRNSLIWALMIEISIYLC